MLATAVPAAALLVKRLTTKTEAPPGADPEGSHRMRIVLVGAGLAAQRCAEALRANGHDGPITMIGGEQHAPYDRPPLSKAILAGERPDLHVQDARTWSC